MAGRGQFCGAAQSEAAMVVPYYAKRIIAALIYHQRSFVHSKVCTCPSCQRQDATGKTSKTYNSGYSLMVTHLTTNPPVSCLSTAERTGSAGIRILWSYVKEVVVGAVDNRKRLVWGVCSYPSAIGEHNQSFS
jgi:hypothetical protein